MNKINPVVYVGLGILGVVLIALILVISNQRTTIDELEHNVSVLQDNYATLQAQHTELSVFANDSKELIVEMVWFIDEVTTYDRLSVSENYDAQRYLDDVIDVLLPYSEKYGDTYYD